MIRWAEQKALARGLQIEFREADAHHLPFPDEAFDVAICECTLCLLDRVSWSGPSDKTLPRLYAAGHQ